MEEDNKTVTMPLSEYRRMEERLASKDLSETEIRKRIEDALVKSMNDKKDFLENVIGLDEFDINVIINREKPHCKTLWDAFQFGLEEYRLELNKSKDANVELIKMNTQLERENKELKEKIGNNGTEVNELANSIIGLSDKGNKKKWYQFWK